MTEIALKTTAMLLLPAPKPLLLLTWDKPCKLVSVHPRRWLIRTPKSGQLSVVK